MSAEHEILIHGYLDGVLTETQEVELNAWVKASEVNAAAFANAVQLHDRLRDVIRAGQLMESARRPASV